MTKQELKELISEAVASELMKQQSLTEDNSIDFYDESVIFESKKTVFISSQGKQIKDKINDVVYENTTRLGGLDWIKSKLFGSNGFLNPDQINKVIKGLDSIFDSLHVSLPIMGATSFTGYVFCIGTKGNYLYRFRITFTQASSKMARLSFNETIIDSKSFRSDKSAEIINFAIKNCSKEYGLTIDKSTISSGKILQGKFEPSTQNVKLYTALQKKFPNDIRYDDSTGKCRFSLSGQL
jgi:hypothetical protein